jgi:hypothetical protein
MSSVTTRGRLAWMASAWLSLTLPTWATDLRLLCPDRPGKNTSPCSLDAGHYMLELNGYDQTFQRRGGTVNDTLLLLNPTLKYGLTDTLDIEASFAPLQSQRIKTAAGDITTGGHGDLYLRTKWMFTGDGEAGFTAVAEPFVKLATATRGLGNGALEGGVMLPFGYDWGNGWQLSTTPEVDGLLDASGHGRHAQLVDAIELNRDLPGGFTLGAEVWTSQNFDPAGTLSQYSVDFDLAWLTGENTQLDGGLNIGLNRVTPDLEIYFGVSQRF